MANRWRDAQGLEGRIVALRVWSGTVDLGIPLGVAFGIVSPEDAGPDTSDCNRCQPGFTVGGL